MGTGRSSPKTPYEIRLDLLQLAFDILMAKHNADGAKASTQNPSPTTSPTTEEVIAEADKLNQFVSKANHS